MCRGIGLDLTIMARDHLPLHIAVCPAGHKQGKAGDKESRQP